MVDRRDELRDEMLVLLSRDGSREAFAALVGRWQEPLWRHARRLTGRDDAASDAVQEAWLDVAGAIGRLREPATFRRWIYTIVTRRAADQLRRRGRDAARSEPIDAAQLAAPPQGPSDAVALLREALARLPDDKRMLLSLHHIDGFDVAEIAAILAVPEGTVKSRLHQARHDLRALIERLDR